MELDLRPYQRQIVESVKMKGSTLVVLPTGLGKTHVALALIKENIVSGGKSLFLTPTKPLARQHYLTMQKTLDLGPEQISLVTGEVGGMKRKALYTAKIFVSTPQTIKNDMKKGIYPAKDTTLAIFDEAHRAVGDYAYVPIAGNLPENCVSLALTASPGGDRARIKEVLSNLNIKNIEIMVETDAAIRPYTKNLAASWIPVDLSQELKEADSHLAALIREYSQKLGNSYQKPPITSKKQFMLYGHRLQAMRHPAKYTLLSHYYALLHLIHLQELLQNQGPHPALNYITKLKSSASRTSAALVARPEMVGAFKILSSAGDHPKTIKLLSLLSSMKNSKVILFVQYRDQINRIKEVLDANGFSSRIFVGKRDGFTKRMQEETMDAFRRDEFKILVASSIGEEGLDIPAVDSVIFFEPIPSEIRSIQRRGRAGRFKDGSVHVLMTRATRDEYYFWASRKREQKMKEILLSLQKEMERKRFSPESKIQKDAPMRVGGQSNLNDF
ncbi:MAG: helicase-related protein [Candidatus ainarchaeum sp.]|nr:helicase-related protein [Candidatus ainarchaeum sp.]